jgi:hypothetical protein
MLEAAASSALSNLDLSKVVLAIGSLGTAGYGVVDTSKAFWGGVSKRGFSDIRKVVSKFVPAPSRADGGASALALPSVLTTLRANWLNGMALPDQRSVAKALIKLNLTKNSAKGMADATGVDAGLLAGVAGKLSTGEALTPQETDVFGRFDLLLAARLDQGYQRGDQRYRNSAKLLAVPIAVGLALCGSWALDGSAFKGPEIWKAVVGGLLATPLAPIAKELASSIQAGAKLAQSWKK